MSDRDYSEGYSEGYHNGYKESLEELLKKESYIEKLEKMIGVFESESACSTNPCRTLYKHVKRGTIYQIVNEGQLQCSKPVKEGDFMVVYADINTGRTWIRSTEEFHDGRYVEYEEGDVK